MRSMTSAPLLFNHVTEVTGFAARRAQYPA